MFQAWLVQKEIENPSKGHHWHFCMGRKHPKHTWDNLLHFFHVSSASWFQSNMAAAAKSLLEDWAVWMLSLQRCLVWSSVLVLSFLPVLEQTWPGKLEFSKLGGIAKTLTGRTTSSVPACPMQYLPRWIFFSPMLLFSNSSCDALDVRKPNNNQKETEKPPNSNKFQPQTLQCLETDVEYSGDMLVVGP